MNRKIIPYTLSAAKNEFLMALGLPVKRCFNNPYIISFTITEKCNARCATCDLWSTSDTNDLSTEDCMNALERLKLFAPHSAINFTGGEPFVRSDFCKILKFANQLGFYTTAITNGLVFDKENCDAIIDTGLDYINFSINSITPEIHDRYKGTPGLHRKIIAATSYIKSRSKKMRICFSAVITKDNYTALADFYIWAREGGADMVDFIPILSSFGHNVRVDGPVIASASNPLLQLDNYTELDKQLDLLIKLKREGAAIVTPIDYIKKMKIYYRSPDDVPAKETCHIGFRNLHLLPNGDVKLCYYFPAIGNIRETDVRDIWFGKRAEEQRREISRCTRPCICSAFREYSITDKLFILSRRASN